MPMLALDTECTGVDFFHGTKPYFVTLATEEQQTWYEWDVDPVTREPQIPNEDIQEIRKLLKVIGGWSKFDERVAEKHALVLQNSKYDVHALASIGITNFPWSQCHDTLVASHILASNQPHDLTSLLLTYLQVDIQPYEDALQEACQEARRWVRHYIKHEPAHPIAKWRIAKEGEPDMPSVKSSSKEKVERGGESERSWKADGWLPRALVKQWWQESNARLTFIEVKQFPVSESEAKQKEWEGWEFRPPEVDPVNHHSWWTVLRDYANPDSAGALMLWKVLQAELKRRGLWKIYLFNRRKMELAYRMERSGVTVSLERLEEQEREFTQRSKECKQVCLDIAAKYNYPLDLPQKGLNNSLRNFCFSEKGLHLPVVKWTEGGSASLDKYAIETYRITLEPGSDQLVFLDNLITSRKLDTGLGFLESYRKYGVPCGEGWIKLHPQSNPTATDTTRFSSSNPNAQQISKQEKTNLRKAFGPMPGRIWYSADAKNIELRIPAYKAGEEDQIALFEKPHEPPYYGSNHLLNFHTIYPDIWEEELQRVGFDKVGPHIKSTLDGSWYTYAKNTGLGIQYRAGKATADKAAHRAGSYDRIMARFAKLHGSGGLNEALVLHARRHGYVETFPSRSIDPQRGYPLMVARNEHGKVKDTTPLSYCIQGTAGVWMAQALVRCQSQLDIWKKQSGFDGFITLTVHDEVVFDMPKVDNNGEDGNLWRLSILKDLMEQGGNDIDVPTPVSVERHYISWADGEELDL